MSALQSPLGAGRSELGRGHDFGRRPPISQAEPWMLTVCSRDQPTRPGTERDGGRWVSGQRPGRWAGSGRVSTQRNGAQMTHTQRKAWLPRRLRGLPTRQSSPRTGLTSGRAGRHRRQLRASSFSPAVPPACHKPRSQRYPADIQGHTERGRCVGRRPLTCGGKAARNWMACKGSAAIHTAYHMMPLSRSGLRRSVRVARLGVTAYP